MRNFRVFAAFAALFVFSTGAQAQTAAGAIEGTVTDSSGAAIPNAKVSVVETATGRVIALSTNEAGRFSARSLPPNVYMVKAEAPNFATKEIRNISVVSSAVITANIQMEVGRTEQIVQVEAQAVVVDTTRQTVDTVITEKQIKDIPLFNRNFLELAALSPGVYIRDGGSIDPTKEGTYRAVGVNGRSGTATRVQIDGIDVTDETVGTTVANIGQDAVSQFQITRSSLDPSTSLTSSGAINIDSRTGSNQIHGAGFWDYYNESMGARLDYNEDLVPFKRQRGGASAGGPFKKNKLFWFANWETHNITQQDIFRSGDFPSLNVDQAFPQKIRYTSGRLDWNATQDARLFYRFQNDDNLTTGGSAVSAFQNIDWTNVHIVALNYNRPTTTHSYRFGYVNFNNRIQSQELDKKFLRVDGLPYYLGVGTFQAGPNGLAPQQTYQDNYQNSYEGSWFKGRHVVRFGFGFTRISLGGFANFAGPLTVNGTFDASTRAAVQRRGANVQDPLEYPFEGFSTGPSNGFFTLRSGHNLPYGGKINNRTSWFVQDSVKFRRLTLNFGLRWQYDSGYFSNDKRVQRDPNLELFGRGFSEFPRAPKNLYSPSFGFNWDPFGDSKTSIRGGFYKAYEMNIFNNLLFDEFAMLPTGIGPDFYDYTHVAGPDGRPINVDNHPDGDYSNLEGRPIKDVIGTIGRVHQALQAAYAAQKFDPASGVKQFTLNGGNVFGGQFPGNQFKVPYALQWNLGIQRELQPGTVLTVDYVYNHGVGLPFFIPDLEFRRDAATLNVAAARTRVNATIGNNTMDQYIASGGTLARFAFNSDGVFAGLTPNFVRARLFQGGFSKYQGLQVSLRGRQMGSKWDFRDASYVLSYALGRSESATSFATRTEFLTNPSDNRNWNSKATFGPNGLDHTSTLGVGAFFTTPGGFRLNSSWRFVTAPPLQITVPNLGGAISGGQAYFGTDVNGDGGTGTTPRGDQFPGLGAGQFGRSVKSFEELNQIITQFNQNFAGKLTPHGRALVTAGLFTEAQLVRLGAVSPNIPLIPAGNPWPFHNRFDTNVRIDRPVKIGERGLTIIPFADVINLFNHAPVNIPYGAGLANRFGALNFNYGSAAAGSQISDLYNQAHRQYDTRRVQIGVRVDF